MEKVGPVRAAFFQREAETRAYGGDFAADWPVENSDSLALLSF
jgi:hypothetical protein